jgi:3-oxoacyl-[acyl-carrier protein] reductase/meso-butanediol dehydrogenase/(S,S)-butanediol dehydrogenase/diacetyl reductase
MHGVGRATALRLAALGADVALTDLQRGPEDLPPTEVRQQWQGIQSVAEEIRALGRRCHTVWCDLGISAQIATMVHSVLEHYGQIDILVNNARAIIGRDRVPITDLREDVWQHFLAINTTAVFLCTKFVGRAMVLRGQGGRIINIASNASKQASANGAAYSASKFAVLGLTQAAALDLAPHRITVNAVCPGPINSGRLSYAERTQAEALGIPLEDYRAQLVREMGQRNPLGRIAESEDVAHLVAFLASEEANYITGQAYNVNGGMLFH